jgi:hypothetical protein
LEETGGGTNSRGYAAMRECEALLKKPAIEMKTDTLIGSSANYSDARN